MEKKNDFQNLFSKYKEAFPNTNLGELQKQCIAFWNSIKFSEDFKNKLNAKLQELVGIIRKRKAKLDMFWANSFDAKKDQIEKNKISNSPSTTCSSTSSSAAPSLVNNEQSDNDENILQEVAPNKNKDQEKKRETPAQDRLKNQIQILNSEIVALTVRDNVNLLSSDENAKLRKKKSELIEAEKKLSSTVRSQDRASKYRGNRKRALQEIADENLIIKKQLRIRDKVGRPSIEDDQPELLKTIINIAIHGSAAHERRQTDVIRSIKTLDELTETLKNDFGFTLSRSAVYLRLLPHRSNTLEGKKHISTVPDKLIRAQNDKHKNHIDAAFCSATIHNLENLASILGPKQVFFISQDDKAKMPIDLTAAKKQAPLLMHLEYRISLPDHDWTIAPAHKLIPSVYAGIKIETNKFGKLDAVTYSGPTYIAIRSAKHSSPTAYSYAIDIDKLMQLTELDDFVKTKNDACEEIIKPIGIFTVDGGPDENPRYTKVISASIHHFLKYNLDALYVVCNAPGRSAFNRAERRMAPLSKELAGVILPHDYFGTHLDDKGRTIDKEKENFAFAAKTLGEIWSNLVIDQFPVVSEFIESDLSEIDTSSLLTKSVEWQNRHVRNSQYCLQIIKCSDENCCSKFRSSLLQVLPNRFLPPPVPLVQTNHSFCFDPENGKYPDLLLSQRLQETVYPKMFEEFQQCPYDVACPSVKEKISRKVCENCGLYYATLKNLDKHFTQCGIKLPAIKIRPQRIAAKRQRELLAIIYNIENNAKAEWFDEEYIDQENMEIPTEISANAPIITIKDHLQSVWEESK